ncbi:hypothetical protein BFJ69_g6192 [Fusarium oxysporum]|uniref:Uncharacterized protein n=1 Tax=Fusarium oxysporum TaxID=5507 RepID=A0A420NAY1_FUSOX|nr:hypothetical protein BFJ69_g6192 [Fusarium oxysporum]
MLLVRVFSGAIHLQLCPLSFPPAGCGSAIMRLYYYRELTEGGLLWAFRYGWFEK